jgi:signal transduction histidine kinase
MKALGDAALDLPWLAPGVASLVTLARSDPFPAWQDIRHDPGAVLLVARASASAGFSFRQCLRDGAPLELALKQVSRTNWTPIDWKAPGPAQVHAACVQQARLAEILAGHVGDCDQVHAWTCALLASLGWLALCAVAPSRVSELLALAQDKTHGAERLKLLVGHDLAALTRRLACLWRLPANLAAVTGNLALRADVAQRLGAPAKLFKVTQMSVLLAERSQPTLAQSVGGTIPELSQSLGVPADLLETVTQEANAAALPLVREEPPLHEVVVRLLEQAQAERRNDDADRVEHLQRDVDRLHEALAQQSANEDARLHVRKLAALAELAGGAGHEINNPLAVISGQAQYLLRQLQLADEQLEEDPSPALYVEALRTKFQKALQTIMGQTQRIHHVLKDLIQFARPATPRPQPVVLRDLLHNSTNALRALAETRKIKLDVAIPEADVGVYADPMQAQAALTQLVRNALEAAPPEGWVGIGFEVGGVWVRVVVQDNGPGPAPAIREHLFDPFFSGRAAGRGRGLGLSTAWRLAREQGGDVRFEGVDAGLTRFVLELPTTTISHAAADNPRAPSEHERNPALHLTE